MEIKNVTFIGLGVMGYNMAGHLKKIILTLLYIIAHHQYPKNGSMNLVENQKKLQEKLLQMLILYAYVLDEMKT